MKILHFILGKANKERANGVNQVIAGLAKYCARQGAEIRVIGKAETVGLEGESIQRDGFSVEAYSKWSSALHAALANGIQWADIVHLHGVFAPWNLLVGRMCERSGRPYVITMHDGLAPERGGRWKKYLFHLALQRTHLERAGGIHLLTEEEGTALMAAANPRYVFCVPNGIDLEDFPRPTPRPPQVPTSLTLGYLGRLSQEKNLEALCQAFSRVNAGDNLHLKIAGPDSNYGRSLVQSYAHCGVALSGPRFGSEKTDFIQSLDLFVHPSLCDAFSIAAMEVLALGTPLLITRTSKASYFYNNGTFFMCEPTAFGLEHGLRTALRQRETWSTRSRNGRLLIEEQLNWSTAAKRLLAEYDTILSRRLS
nr:glycosyltransferase family 4 protein [uncultured Holophaga sp.]